MSEPVDIHDSRARFQIHELNRTLTIETWGEGNHHELNILYLTADSCKKLAKMFRESASRFLNSGPIG